MMPKCDMLACIAKAGNRFEAAILVRALAAHLAATLHCHTAQQRIDTIERAERLAESLERDFALTEDGEPLPDHLIPWREWLARAGYGGQS